MLCTKNNINVFLITIITFFLIFTGVGYAAIERTLTDNGKIYTPSKHFSQINFEEELGVENTSLQDLGRIIDDGYKYCDAALLTRAAVILGYQEKQWNTRSRQISAEELLNRAVEIARYKNDKDALKSIMEAYNEQSLSVYNPEKAKELQDFLDKIPVTPNNNLNKGTIIVYNNSRKNNLLVYIDDIFVGQLPRNGIMRFRDISAGRITLSANDGDSLQWGPRKVFLGKDNIFHWKLY